MQSKYKIKLTKKNKDGYNFLCDDDDELGWGWGREENALIFDLEKSKRIQAILDFKTELINGSR